MSILKRTVFYEGPNHLQGRVLRFEDWALTITTLGAMAEPFNVGDRVDFFGSVAVNDFDATDEISRIDSIQSIDRGQLFKALPNNWDKEQTPLHGGFCIPRISPY